MKKGISTIFFILCLTYSLFTLNNVFKFKYGDGVYDMKIFYEQKPNTIDVMMFGSSHIFENINTAVLWNDFGIPSFSLCGSLQPLWNTYYYMKESLKYQTPKLMIVDTYMANMRDDYSDDSRIVKNNFGLHVSHDKELSIKESTPPNYFPTYNLEYPLYHSRYKEISKTDHLKYQANSNFFKYWKGSGSNFAKTPLMKPEVNNVKDTRELSTKSKKYLLKIVELAKEKDIPLLLITTPYQITKEDKQICNSVEIIAKENNLPYINYNLLYDKIGLDFNNDFADMHHLNYIGNAKFTYFLGNEIKKMYSLPNHIGDNKYDSYEKNKFIWIEQLAIQKIKNSLNLNEYLKSINQKNTVSIITFGESVDKELTEDEKQYLYDMGVQPQEKLSNRVLVILNKNILFNTVVSNKYSWSMDLNEFNTLNVRNDKVLINNVNYTKASQNINIVTYNIYINEYIESVQIDLENSRNVLR